MLFSGLHNEWQSISTYYVDVISTESVHPIGYIFTFTIPTLFIM
jgi:hypothetical protein